MAEENEDFGAGGDFRSKPDDMNDTAEDQGEDKDTPAARRADEYTRVLLAEKLSIDEAKHPVALKLLDAEITKVQTEGRGTRREPKYVNIYRDKPVKIACRVLVPLKDHPKFNFMGKLLGPKGNSLKRLQDDTMCKMSILGRGSMRDSKKEEELRNSLDTKYAHLSDDLHVEVTALGPPAEAYARIAFALTELRKYLTPDGSDEISHSQLREMGLYEDRPKPRSGPPGARPGMRGPPMSQAAARPSMPMRPGPRGPAPRGPGPGPRGTPGKSNALSILERARAAIEQNYEEPYDEPYEPEQAYDDYPTSGPSRPGFGGNRFGGSNYNSDYYDNGSDNFRENQRWKPLKPSGPPARSEQPRYRATPYARAAKQN